MTIDTDGLEFDALDKFAWRTFLQTRAGLRLVPKAAEAAPQLLGSGDTNAILTRAGELRGFQHAIQTLLSLAEATPEPAAPERISYPPLEADDQWQDGQTLNKK